MATPIHWRGPTWKPKMRSAITARITTPVERTAWTTDSGAKASAATWKNQAPVATAMPIANHLHEYSCFAVRKRMPDVDRGGLVRALVLVKKAQLRGDGAGQREQDAQIQRHVSSYVRSVGDSSPAVPLMGFGFPRRVLLYIGPHPSP